MKLKELFDSLEIDESLFKRKNKSLHFDSKKSVEEFKAFLKSNPLIRHKIKVWTKDAIITGFLFHCWQSARWEQLAIAESKIITTIKTILDYADTIPDIKDRYGYTLAACDFFRPHLEEFSNVSAGGIEAKKFMEKNIKKFELGGKALENLASGSKYGTKKRQSTAVERKATLTKAIEELFKNGAGWKMTNEEITDFLINHNIDFYERSTILSKVKRIVATIKKAEKDKSGQKNPN